MAFLNMKIKNEFQIDCFYPANGETLTIDTPISLPVDVQIDFLKRTISSGISDPKRQKLMHGTLTIYDSENGESVMKLGSKDEFSAYGIEPHRIRFKTFIRLNCEPNTSFMPLEEITQVVFDKLKR